MRRLLVAVYRSVVTLLVFQSHAVLVTTCCIHTISGAARSEDPHGNLNS